MEKPLEELLAEVRVRAKFPEDWNPITNQADTMRVARIFYPSITFAENGPNMTVRYQQTEMPVVIKLIHLGTVICKRIVEEFQVIDTYHEPPPEPIFDEREGLVEITNITDSALALAEEYGINLETVEGSGAGGKVIKKDVQAAINAQLDDVEDV